ncbi:MAG: ATPase domain-containing protein [Candidatus Njordarchaeia archaeon]
MGLYGNLYFKGGYYTGNRSLDEMGGIPYGEITEIVGPSGSGKTIFLHQIAVASFVNNDKNKKVIFFDTDLTFDSKRLYKVSSCFNMEPEKILSHVLVYQAADFSSLNKMLMKLDPSEVNLIIIDSITNLLPMEESQLEENNYTQLRKIYKTGLMLLKFIRKAPKSSIVISNQVRFSPNRLDGRKKKEDSLFGKWSGDLWLDENLAPSMGIVWEEFIDNRIYLKQIRRNMRAMYIVFSSGWPETIIVSNMEKGIIFK